MAEVGDDMCWRQIWDVGDGFGRFRHLHPLSFTCVGHKNPKNVTNMKSSTSTCHQHICSRTNHQFRRISSLSDDSDVGDIVILVTLWWRLISDVGGWIIMLATFYGVFSQCIKSVTTILNRSSTSQICHQHRYNHLSCTEPWEFGSNNLHIFWESPLKFWMEAPDFS